MRADYPSGFKGVTEVPVPSSVAPAPSLPATKPVHQLEDGHLPKHCPDRIPPAILGYKSKTAHHPIQGGGINSVNAGLEEEQRSSLFLQAEVEKHGGTFYLADHMAILKGAEKAGLPEADIDGICCELCRISVSKSLENTWRKGSTVYDLVPQDKDALKDIIIKHQKIPSNEIEGVQLVETLIRTRHSFISKRISWNRGEFSNTNGMLNAIFASPGIWIYMVHAPSGKGHTFFFDTRNADDLTIMDPNYGEINLPSIHAFRAVFNIFWNANYKAFYKHGRRQLDRYFSPTTQAAHGGREIQFTTPFPPPDSDPDIITQAPTY